ncbi:MAG: hypothetical protein PHQ04_07965 [Opitutaceae bacterium]|nr:hypothetical protein [Opitutaceae bacterium]
MRALLVACLLLGASIVVNIVLPVSPAEDDGLGMIDPVAELLEVF